VELSTTTLPDSLSIARPASSQHPAQGGRQLQWYFQLSENVQLTTSRLPPAFWMAPPRLPTNRQLAIVKSLPLLTIAPLGLEEPAQWFMPWLRKNKQSMTLAVLSSL
jgi:hypothetical protein